MAGVQLLVRELRSLEPSWAGPLQKKKKKFGLGPANFEVPIRCPRRDLGLANGYRNLVFKEGI